MPKFSFQGLRGPRSPGLAPMVSPCLPQHPRSTQGHREQPPQEFTCKPGLRAASAIPLGVATGKGQLCRVAQVRTTDLLKGSRGPPPPPFEKELGERPGCGWGGWGGAFQLPFLPPPPCPPPPPGHIPAATPPRLQGMCLFYPESRKRHKPLGCFLSALLGSAGNFTKGFHKY